MTFGRALIIAAMGALFATARGVEDVGYVALIGWACWQLTVDPVPGAVKSALRDFAREWRRG